MSTTSQEKNWRTITARRIGITQHSAFRSTRTLSPGRRGARTQIPTSPIPLLAIMPPWVGVIILIVSAFLSIQKCSDRLKCSLDRNRVLRFRCRVSGNSSPNDNAIIPLQRPIHARITSRGELGRATSMGYDSRGEFAWWIRGLYDLAHTEDTYISHVPNKTLACRLIKS